MSIRTRLAGYAAVLAVLFGGGYALGNAFPDDSPAPSPHVDHLTGAGHTGTDHTGTGEEDAP